MQMLGHGHQSEINMTPMIDVLLTLIVVFIVAYQIRFAHEVRVPPRQTVPSRSQQKPIVLDLLDGGEYAVNSRPVPSWALRPVLKALFAPRLNKILYVRVGDGWNYASVMAAIDQAKEAGVEDVVYLPGGVPTGEGIQR